MIQTKIFCFHNHHSELDSAGSCAASTSIFKNLGCVWR